MRKTCNPTYLGSQKVGWNVEITKFGLFMVWPGKIPNFINVFSQCQHLFFMDESIDFSRYSTPNGVGSSSL